MAFQAIMQMDEKESAAKCREKELADNASAFIKECKDNGRNPVDVIKFIQTRDGISLSAGPPDDPVKRIARDIIMKAVDMIIERGFVAINTKAAKTRKAARRY